MNYQKLYDCFEREYEGKNWKMQETKKQVSTLFAKWLVRNNYLIKKG